MERTLKVVQLMLAVVIAAGCATVPEQLRYEGQDKIRIVSTKSSFASYIGRTGANTRIVSANGIPRDPPYPPGDEEVFVRAGRQRIGIVLSRLEDPRHGFWCAEFSGQAGHNYEFSATTQGGMFIVTLMDKSINNAMPIQSVEIRARHASKLQSEKCI